MKSGDQTGKAKIKKAGNVFVNNICTGRSRSPGKTKG
jgi:hypothetical protein